MMRFQPLGSLKDLDAREFDGLDASCGPVGSYARLVQLERDRRWSTEYLCARESGRLLAAVPLYRLRQGAWPDPSYDPVAWGLDLAAPPNEITVVGGRSGVLSSLHVAPAISGTRRHLRLIEELLAREPRETLLLPFLTATELSPWEVILGTRLDREVLGADARFDRHLAGESFTGESFTGETFSSKIQQTLRSDQRLAQRFEVESAVRTWGEVRSFAAGLIARNSLANGMPDAEQLVDFRVRQWEACDGVSVAVITAQARGERGVVVCVCWQDWMDLQEVGITGRSGHLRRTLYAQLLLHLPLRLARQRGGIRHLRAGLMAEQPKAIRGASFVPLVGGAFTFASRPERTGAIRA